MEAIADFSQTMLVIYDSTRRNKPEGCYFHIRRPDNVKCLVLKQKSTCYARFIQLSPPVIEHLRCLIWTRHSSGRSVQWNNTFM